MLFGSSAVSFLYPNGASTVHNDQKKQMVLPSDYSIHKKVATIYFFFSRKETTTAIKGNYSDEMTSRNSAIFTKFSRGNGVLWRILKCLSSETKYAALAAKAQSTNLLSSESSVIKPRRKCGSTKVTFLKNLVRYAKLELACKESIPYRAIWAVERNDLHKTISVDNNFPHHILYL